MDEYTPQRRINRTLLTIIILLAAAAGGLLFHIATDHNIPFDSVAWREHSSVLHQYGARQGMIRDLQKNVLKQGMTRSEIEALLGESDSIGIPQDLPIHDYVYGLGSGQGTSGGGRFGGTFTHQSSDQWLILNLNHHGQLSDWRVITAE